MQWLVSGSVPAGIDKWSVREEAAAMSGFCLSGVPSWHVCQLPFKFLLRSGSLAVKGGWNDVIIPSGKVVKLSFDYLYYNDALWRKTKPRCYMYFQASCCHSACWHAHWYATVILYVTIFWIWHLNSRVWMLWIWPFSKLNRSWLWCVWALFGHMVVCETRSLSFECLCIYCPLCNKTVSRLV